MKGISEHPLRETFDRIVVLNLARRPERLARFRNVFKDWPFRQSERFEAIDGSTIPTPPQWDKGPGAWGCLLSHRRILDSAIRDGVGSLFVLEDDAIPIQNFPTLAERFLRNVPDNWDALMFGAEHLLRPRLVSDGIVRCLISNRAHAYAVRGSFMNILAQYWNNNTVDHCDIVLASLMQRYNVYAPDPLLIGQDSGYSDISARHEYRRFLPADQKPRLAAKIYVRSPAELMTHK